MSSKKQPSVHLCDEYLFESLDRKIALFILITSDSKLETNESKAFFSSSIEELNVPASLSLLKKGWWFNTKTLKKVTVDSKSRHFKNNEELIIGKSDIFDVFEFASRDVKLVLIPSKIEKISLHSFLFSSIEKVVISPSVELLVNFLFLTV